MTCQHTFTRGRENELGSWCISCGEKIFDVDPRECRDCLHHKRLIDGSICTKHMMGVSPDMHVYFKIVNGTCWTENPPPERAETDKL